MTNVVKKDGGQAQHTQGSQQGKQGAQQGPRGELVRRDPFAQLMRDPFQLMRDLIVDPWRLLQVPFGATGREINWNVGFDVRETDDAFIFKADLPGIDNNDLEISLTGNQLQISGKREYEQEQDEGRVHTYERSYGTFSRSFSLPESADLDKIKSDLKDGVLTLVVPKKPGATPQRRKIQIGSSSRS